MPLAALARQRRLSHNLLWPQALAGVLCYVCTVHGHRWPMGMCITLGLAISEQAPARDCMPAWLVLVLAEIQALLCWWGMCSPRPGEPELDTSARIRCWLALQATVVLLPALFHYLRKPLARRQSSQVHVECTAQPYMPAQDLPYPCQQHSSEQYTPWTSYKSQLKSIPVSIKLLTPLEPSDLSPAQLASFQGTINKAGSRLPLSGRVLDVGVRCGCILIATDLLHIHNNQQEAEAQGLDAWPSPNAAMQLAQAVLPGLMQELGMQPAAQEPTASPLAHLQLGDNHVTVSSDPSTSALTFTDVTNTNRSLLPQSIKPQFGIVWTQRASTARNDSFEKRLETAASDSHVVHVKAQLLSVCQDAVGEGVKVAGSEPWVRRGHGPAAAEEAAQAAVVEVWARTSAGYCPVRVTPPAEGSTLFQIDVYVPGDMLTRHHPSSPPTCIQLLQLELWTGHVLHASTTVMSRLTTAVAPWWGVSNATAAAALQELELVAELLWEQRVEQPQAQLQGYTSMVSDLAVCLATLRQCAWSQPGYCANCQHKSTSCSSGLSRFPCADMQLLHTSLLQYTARVQLRCVQRLVEECQQQTHACEHSLSMRALVCGTSTPHPGAHQCGGQHNRMLQQVMWHLRICALGYDCPECEALFRSQLMAHISPVMQGWYAIQAAGGFVICTQEQRLTIPCITLLLWSCVLGTAASLLLLRTHTQRLHKLVNVLHLVAFLLHASLLMLVNLGMDVPASVKRQHRVGTWIIMYALQSVAELVPLQAWLSARQVTCVSLGVALLHYRMCNPDTPRWFRAVGCFTTAVPVVMAVNGYLRQTIMNGAFKSGSTTKQGSRAPAGGELATALRR